MTPRRSLPLSLIARDGPVLFKGRARNLAQRLDALKAVAEARLPSLQDVDPASPNYCPGLSRRVHGARTPVAKVPATVTAKVTA